MQFERRKTLRHKEHDYSKPGFYFLTICAFEKQKLFGDIKDHGICLNKAGEIIVKSWKELPKYFTHLSLDAFTLMPNHFHALIRLSQGNTSNLSQIIRNFKSTSSRKIRMFRHLNVWQKGFYDRIVRTERELNLIRLYIDLNPLMWDETKELSDIDFRTEEDLARMLEPYRRL
jgi:REP-associated tyrosine transposase